MTITPKAFFGGVSDIGPTETEYEAILPVGG
jgi:hypothetical protein